VKSQSRKHFRGGNSYTFDNLYQIDKGARHPGFRPLLGLILLLVPCTAPAQFQNFLKARGDKLMDGSAELRFVSYNIPNLHYIEDNHQFAQVNPWRIADEFEIRDALTTIRQMGGNVTRMYVPSVRKAIDDSTIVRHVLAPGVFNEEAFRAYDRILQVANQTGVRVIIPLVDNWWWWGGPKEYAAFRGKSKDEFWTDSTLIADFKKTVAFIINRVNTYTGVPFREDRAIFGWETGNELV
jgi:mannan endo-1,4-beta-mannosidase